MPDVIPGQWLTVKQLRGDIETAIDNLIDDPKYKGLSYEQLLAALTQATANFAAQDCIESIRGGRKKTGFVFPMPA